MFGEEDLKQVRLVSKDWCELVTGRLFDTIYISPHEKNMEVFKEMTGHPVIAGAIRSLFYDTVHFRRFYSQDEYWVSLFHTWIIDIARSWRKETFICSDPQINTLIKQCKMALDTSEPWSRIERVRILHRNDGFVKAGYTNYKRNAMCERRTLRDETFLTGLCVGFSTLNQLASICLGETPWDIDVESGSSRGSSSLCRLDCGSPLARTWSPFCLRPTTMNDYEDGDMHISRYLRILTAALASSSRRLSSIELGNSEYVEGLPPSALTVPIMSAMGKEKVLTAYSRFEELYLTMFSRVDDRNDNLVGLQSLLENAPNLESLTLFLDKESIEQTPHRFDQVFPRGRFSPNLKYLTLHGLAVKALDLIILIWQWPHLKYLEIEWMDLLEGSWEGIIEALRNSHVKLFNLISCDLKHHGGVLFLTNSNDPGPCKLRNAIKKYVMHGGRHPCLAADQPANSAFSSDTPVSWFLNIFPDEWVQGLKATWHETGYDLNSLLRQCQSLFPQDPRLNAI